MFDSVTELYNLYKPDLYLYAYVTEQYAHQAVSNKSFCPLQLQENLQLQGLCFKKKYHKPIRL
jgi:hypothetical protein